MINHKLPKLRNARGRFMILAKPDRMSGGGGWLYHGAPIILGNMSND